MIIYNPPSFIKIILFHHLFFNYFPYLAPPPYLTCLKHSLSFFFSFFFLLASFFFYVFLLQHLLSFFFFFISKKKNLSLSLPLFLYQISALFKSKKKISLPSPHGSIHSLSLSHGDSKPGFWLDLYFAKWVFYCVLF